MLTVPSIAQQPTQTVDLLPGIRVEVAAMRSRDLIEARTAARRVYAAKEGEADTATSADATWAMAVAFAKCLIRSWDGITDEAGEPAPVTPENVESIMGLPEVYTAFDDLVVAPALARVAEGNGLRNSPAGTSATEAQPTAPAAA